ncbi:hypothetical protein ABZZ79_28785 [Streptomyces sp. NPDC006458]|uniref:hypothetical protein n=1 Tax=Streptomyces sp. NPDC006458 TaxID=3154302 RepID=UPI0033B531F8
MTTAPPPVNEPDPSALTCPGDQVGPCAACQRKTHKYGRGGTPLCQWCMEPALAKWGPNARYVSTRT